MLTSLERLRCDLCVSRRRKEASMRAPFSHADLQLRNRFLGLLAQARRLCLTNRSHHCVRARRTLGRPVRGRLLQTLVCQAIILNLLIWPAPGAAHVLVDLASNAVRSSTVTLATDSARLIAYTLRFLFGTPWARAEGLVIPNMI